MTTTATTSGTISSSAAASADTQTMFRAIECAANTATPTTWTDAAGRSRIESSALVCASAVTSTFAAMRMHRAGDDHGYDQGYRQRDDEPHGYGPRHDQQD